MKDPAIMKPLMGASGILGLAVLMVIIFALTWGVAEDHALEKNTQQEVKTLTGYRFLLGREPLKTMGDRRRADLEVATWDLPTDSRQDPPGAYSAFKTRVQTHIEDYKGQLAMKVNYAGLNHGQCLALTEVAKQVQQPYVINGGKCIEKNRKNAVAIYFAERNGAE